MTRDVEPREERLEQSSDAIGRDAAAAVGNVDDHAVLISRRVQRNFPAIGRELDGVEEQVVQAVAQFVDVDAHRSQIAD